MKILRNILIALSIFTTSALAFAGNVSGAKVYAIRVDASGLGIVTFNISMTAPAGCINSAYANALAFNTNTAGGKAMLAAIIFARSKNTSVYAYGTGACSLYAGAVEDLSLFYEQN